MGIFYKERQNFIGVCASIHHSFEKQNWISTSPKTLEVRICNRSDWRIDSTSQKNPSLQCIIASVDKCNIASIKILEKYMTFEKENYDAQTGRCEYHYKLLVS